MKSQAIFQIGKNGITEGVIDSLFSSLKTHSQVRISVLKSSGRNRETIKSMAENIVAGLPVLSHYKIVGFTIILKKLSHSKKKQ